MNRQLDLFAFATPLRRKPRRLMHVMDWGSGWAFFRCRCGFASGWVPAGKFSDDKRGRPCPRCNGGASS